MAQITEASRELFRALAEDAGNWSGTPPTDGNVSMSAAERGNLTQLKRAGLLTTFRDEGMTWVTFTQAGFALAASMGIAFSDSWPMVDEHNRLGSRSDAR